MCVDVCMRVCECVHVCVRVCMEMPMPRACRRGCHLQVMKLMEDIHHSYASQEAPNDQDLQNILST